jgi:3-hydroxyacyl-CoA dehydrogenase/enoyl-CoA hydratase/carnithine racemase
MMGNIFTLKKEDNIGIVSFNVPGEAMNTWTEEAISGFCEFLDVLEKEKNLAGCIFISGKPDNFFAGANLKMLEQMNDPVSTKKGLDYFHNAFNKLSEFKIPTLAAINGVCAGGGLEFALACTARMATDAKNTVIGLPECKVGLFPGGGGSQRLPRLIGYGAIELILKGTLLPAAKALETGIIDRIITPDKDLLTEAKAFLLEIISGKAELKRPVHDFSQIKAVADMARQGVLKMTKGREIPGLMLFIKAVEEGLNLPLKEALEVEKKYFAETVLTPEAKGSINTFFIKTMTDKPKNMMTKGFTPKPLKKAAILGFGTMGRGIIINILRNTQLPIIVKDFPEALESGLSFVRKILTGMAEKKRLTSPVDDLMKRITTISDHTPEFKEVDIVIEAVFESIDVKKEAYESLCKAVRDDCLIASNTSSIPIAAMARFVTLPERFGGIHFFSPVWIMELVEIIQGEKTSRDTVDNLLNFAASIRKRPIVCKDNPGFVVNALLFPYLLGAFEYLEKGNSIEKIDQAIVQFGMPVGPLRLTDEVGIDIPYKVLSGMGIKQDTLKNIVESGRLGLKKSGKGMFLKDGSVDPEVLPLIVKREPKEMSASEIQMGLLTGMVKVGKDLLDRKIVEDPRMIDVGMIWGTGFPPDKGGPLKWSDLIGLSKKLFGKNFY